VKVVAARYEGSAVEEKGMPTNGLPEVAFAGRSNVGKSSLINCLTGIRGLAKTSSTPGRTQCLNFFSINYSFYFVDLPGYGYAKAPLEMRTWWQRAVDRYLKSRAPLRGLILILDGRHDPADSDLRFKDRLLRYGVPHRIVLTKMDKLPRGKWEGARKRAAELLSLPPEELILFSSLTGEGKKDLWRAIRGMLERGAGESREG